MIFLLTKCSYSVQYFLGNIAPKPENANLLIGVLCFLETVRTP
jgi:hypothetical protein